MTTSHRPTFFTAKGSDRGGGQATFQVCDDTYEHIVINLITFLILSVHPSIYLGGPLRSGFFEELELSHESQVSANRSKCQIRGE